MKIANVPKKMSVVFGVNGQRQDLLPDTVSGEPNASYNAGFPPITMIAKSAGGQAPLGKDFNQIFNELSADAQWNQASGIYPYDSEFSTSIGGYPKGSIVLGSDGVTIYQSQSDDNTEDLTSSSWVTLAGDSSKYLTVANGGDVLPDVVSIFNVTKKYTSFRTRGFYSAGDGGDGTWVSTGVNTPSLAGTHVVNKAKVYDSTGNEYVLSLNKTTISAQSNGLKEGNLSSTSSDFICLGQVINGITSIIKKTVANRYDLQGKGLTISMVGGNYRVGRESVKITDWVTYDYNGSRVRVVADPSLTYAITGSRIDFMSHGISEIDQAYKELNGTVDWDYISMKRYKVLNVYVSGDHLPSRTESSCSAGIGLNMINTDYGEFSNIEMWGFMWCIDARQINSLRNKDGTRIIESSVVTETDYGQFYGHLFENVRCTGGRKGLVRLGVDWSNWIGGSISDGNNWLAGVDAVRPDYFLYEFSHGSVFQGVNLTVEHEVESTENYQPGKSVIATAAMGTSFQSCYLEHTPSYATILAAWWNDGNVKGRGVNFDLMGNQYRPRSLWKYITFEDGCFGSYVNGVWVSPAQLSSYPSHNGINFMRMGSPTRDLSAFEHGGYDFKYASYNIGYTGSTPPDIDNLRGLKTTKEMFNPYGFQVSNTRLLFPFKNPSFGSNICIWYKDLTGSFDPINIVAFNSANNEAGSSANGNLYISYGESCIDFGNGYKMAIIQNIYPLGVDGHSSWEQAFNLNINIPSNTPIVLKAIEAYTGGVPLFPQGCDYTPKSSLSGIWGGNGNKNQTNSENFSFNLGGGIFFPGDIAAPYAYADPHNTNGISSVWSDFGYSTQSQVVNSGGNSGLINVGAGFRKTLSATISSVTSTSTTLTFTADTSPYVGLSIPINVSSGSSTSVTGTFYPASRVLNSDGTLSYSYVFNSVLGASGDVLTLDQTVFTRYSKLFGVAESSSSSIISTSPSVSFKSSPTTTLGSITSSSSVMNIYHTTLVDFQVSVKIDYNLTVASTLTVTGSIAGFKLSGDIVGDATGSRSIGSSSVLMKNGYFQYLYCLGGNVTSLISTVPTSASSTGTKGQIATDSSYIYVCTATNTWVRTPITSW